MPSSFLGNLFFLEDLLKSLLFSVDAESLPTLGLFEVDKRFSNISEQDFSSQRANVLNSMDSAVWADEDTNNLRGSTASTASRRLHVNFSLSSSIEFSIDELRKI
jgi:hypothetical protein